VQGDVEIARAVDPHSVDAAIRRVPELRASPRCSVAPDGERAERLPATDVERLLVGRQRDTVRRCRRAVDGADRARGIDPVRALLVLTLGPCSVLSCPGVNMRAKPAKSIAQKAIAKMLAQLTPTKLTLPKKSLKAKRVVS
jgi:hypothetical protein